MSTTIDNRVVEMTFDNGQFEQGVKVSLKSLEDLKKGLELDKAASSLSNLEKAASNFNLSGIEDAVQSLQKRFSALGIVGMKALENITDRAVNAGVAMMKSLSIDQLAGGMQKYESETSAIATMQYAIEGGKTEEGTKRIYEAVEKLQQYADETSYSFSDMISNMSKFIAAGAGLEESERAMEGIANWAAKSGVSAQSANFSRAMYNLSQSMGQGTVRVQDWMSIENAQMATRDFKKEVIEVAKEVGTVVEREGELYAAGVKVTDKNKENHKINVDNMRTTLADGWFTKEVLVKVLEKYADRTTEFGMEAFLAAQQARTFTDAIEATKDAVSTGWARSFRLIFGDIEEATRLFTDMANGMIAVVDTVKEFRNGILQTWHDNKGREEFIAALTNIWNIIRGIGYSFLEAFGLNADGLTTQLGNGLVELSKKFNEVTSAALALFEVYEEITGGESKKTSKTFNKVTSDLSKMQEEAKANAAAVEGMINTGTVKMSEQTEKNFRDLAAAYKDLDEYIASGDVDADELQKKLDNINELLGKTQKTNKLMKRKQTALKAMADQLKGYKEAGTESTTVTKEVEEEMTEEEKVIHYRSQRIREIFTGLRGVLSIFSATMGSVGSGLVSFASKFTPLISPVLNLAASFGMLINHISETGGISEKVSGWVSRITDSFSPLTDKVQVVVGWFNTLAGILFDRENNTFLNGPEGQKIQNVLDGIHSAINLVVGALSSALNVASFFVSTFMLPLVGPAARAVLEFFSGLGKAIVGLDKAFSVGDLFGKAVEQVKNFLTGIKDSIVSSTIFQRARTILSSFFSTFSQKPGAALNYLKAVGRGLAREIGEKYPVVQKAGAALKSFGTGILNTFRNSKRLQKAKRFASNFFKLFQKDPAKSIKVLKLFGKTMLANFTGSKPIQALLAFKDKALTFLKGLFPKAELEKVGKRAKRLISRLGKTFEEKGFLGMIRDLGTKIKAKLKELGDAFANSPVGQKLIAWKNQIVNAFNNLKRELGIDELIARVKGFLGRLTKAYEENGVAGAINLVKETVVRKLGELKAALLQNGIVKKLVELKNRIKQAFRDFAEKAGLSEKLEKFRKFFADLKTTFSEKGPITALTKFKNALIQKVTTFMSGFSFSGIIAKFRNWFTLLKEAIANANVGAAFDDLKNTIKEKLKNLLPKPSEVTEGDDGQTKSLFETIKERVMTWVTTFREQLINGVKSIPVGKILAVTIGAGIAFVVAKIALGFSTLAGGLGNLMNKLAGKKVKNADDTAKVLNSLAIAIGTLAVSLLILSLIPKDRLLLSVGVLATCLGGIVGLAALIKKFDLTGAMKAIFQAGIGLLGIASAVAVLAIAIWMFSLMKPETFIKGGLMVVGVLTALGTFLVLMNKFGGTNFKAKPASLLAVAGAVVILAVAVGMLGGMDLPTLAKGITGMVLVLGALMGFIIGVNKLGTTNGKVPKGIVSTVMGIAFAMNRLIGPIKQLGKMKLDVWAKGLGGFAVILLAIFAFMAGMNKFGGVGDAGKIGGVLVVMIGIAGLMWVFAEQMVKVANVPWQVMVAFGAAFTAVVLSVAGAVTVMSAIPAAAMIKGILGLTAAVVLIGIALNLIAKLTGNTAAGMSENLFVIGANLKAFSDMVTGLNTDAMYAAIQFMKDFSAAAVEVGSEDYTGLDTFGGELVDMGADLRLFNTLVSGISSDSVATAIQVMKDFSAAAVEVMSLEYGPLDTFRGSMTRMGSALRLYSTLTSDLAAPESDPLTTISASLSEVYTNVSGLTDIGDLTSAITNIGSAVRLYYSQISGVDTSKGVADLSGIGGAFAQLVANMPAEEDITEIKGYAAGGNHDLTNFALGITAIGSAFEEFAKIADTVKEDKVTAATTALERIKTLSEGMSSKKVDWSFAGVIQQHSEELTSFPEQVVLLGGALSAFSNLLEADETAGRKAVDMTKVDSAIEAIGKIAEINTAITGASNNFGFLTFFSGKQQDLTDFAEDIVGLGGAISAFGNFMEADEATGRKAVDLDKIKASTAVLDEFATLSTKLTPVGGVVEWFNGKQGDLGTFASRISTLGTGMANYANAIKDSKFTNVDKSLAPLSALADVQNKLAGGAAIGGLIGALTNQGMTGFSGNLGELGAGMAAFGDAVAGHNFDQAQAAANAILALAHAHNQVNSTQGRTDLSDFADDAAKIGTKLADLQNNASSVDATRISEITAMLNGLLAAGVGWSQMGDAKDGAKKMLEFFTAFSSGNGLLGSGDTISIMAGQMAQSFNQAFTGQINAAPTISPVLDMTNFDPTNQLGNLFNTETLSASIATAISGAIDFAPVTTAIGNVETAVGNVRSDMNSNIGSLRSDVVIIGSKVGTVIEAVNEVTRAVNSLEIPTYAPEGGYNTPKR